MTPLAATSIALLLVLSMFVQAPAPARCPNDGPAPRAGRTIDVKNIGSLEDAVHSARPGDTIVVAPGDYGLRASLDIAAPDVTLRGAVTDASKVVLRGGGMDDERVGVGISISAPGVVVANLTVRSVGYHAVQVRGEQGASRFVLYNAHLQDTGQQMLKGSIAHNNRFADDGLVACSEFSYTTNAPSAYTDGIDILAAKGWLIRDNRFTRIRGPEKGRWSAGPAIVAWATSEDTVVERNVIVDSFRGIALGLGPGVAEFSRTGDRSYDHLRGTIRNNVVVNLNRWADEAIEANAARDARIEYNTVLVESAGSPWSIGVRFPSASADVRNNLTNQRILLRDGGHATMQGNVAGAMPTWFVDPPHADLHLTSEAASAVDAGVAIPDVNDDFDRGPRSIGKAPDAGAFESRPGAGSSPR